LWLLFRCSEDYKWIGNKFETLDAGQRDEFTERMEQADIIPSDAIPEFLEGIQDSSALREGYEMLARNILRGPVENQVERLEKIGDATLRISLLENSRAMKTDDAGVAFMRQKLIDWKASPAQTASILSSYQP
jgi:hypothetical protein